MQTKYVELMKMVDKAMEKDPGIIREALKRFLSDYDVEIHPKVEAAAKAESHGH